MSELVRQANRLILEAVGGSAAVCTLFQMDDPDAFQTEFVDNINFLKCMAEHCNADNAPVNALKVWHKLIACCDYNSAQQADMETDLLATASALATSLQQKHINDEAATGEAEQRKRKRDAEAAPGEAEEAAHADVSEIALVSLCYWAFVFDRTEHKKGRVFRRRKKQPCRILRAVRGVWMPPPTEGHMLKVTSAVGGAWDSGPKHTLTSQGTPGAWIVDTWTGMVEAACTGQACEEIQLVLLRNAKQMSGDLPQPWHFEPGKEEGAVPLLLRHNKGGYLAHSHHAPCTAPQKLADSLRVSCHTLQEADASLLSDETCRQVCGWASLQNGALVIMVLQCVVETESARWWMPTSDALGRKHPDSLSIMEKLNVQLTAYGQRYRHII